MMSKYTIHRKKKRAQGVPTVNQSGNISANYINNGVIVIRYSEVGLYQHYRSSGISGNVFFNKHQEPNLTIMRYKHD